MSVGFGKWLVTEGAKKFLKSKLPMTNFPYDIQMTSMFIFITLYLVMEIIF